MKTSRHRANALVTSALLALCACGDDQSGKTYGSGPGGDGGPNPFGNVDPDAATMQGDSSLPLGDGEAPPEPTCGSSPFGASLAEVHVLLVIDKSGSMAETPEGFDGDKWSAMKTSLATSLAEVDDNVGLGLALYPIDGCSVPAGSDIEVSVQPSAQALPDVLAALDDAMPSGGTPTAAALARAHAYFTDGAGSVLTGDKFVLLATDGGPNCNDSASCGAATCTVNIDGMCPAQVANCCDPDQAGEGAQAGCLDDDATTAAIAALAADGVDTFVVGIPGTETYAESLDAFAESGGRPSSSDSPRYFAVSASGDGASGLTSVLRAITGSLITSCRLQLDSDPPDLRKLNVEVDGTVVTQGDDGWALDTSTSPPTVELLGESCDRIEQNGVENVTVTFGCPTMVD